MKIAIDAIGVHYSGGGRTSILNLLQNLFEIDNTNQYLIFLSQYEPSLESSAGNTKQFIVPLKNRFAVRLYAQAVFPYIVKGFDLVHFSKNLGLFGPLPPTVVTVHDLTTILYPKVVPWFDYLYWRTLQGITIRSARLVTTVSYMAAKDLAKIYKIPTDRIRVIYHGCAKMFKPSTQDDIRTVLEKYNVSDPYILHIGRIDLKKNLTTLVKSFDRLRKNTGFRGKLVLVGEEYKKSLDLSLRPTVDELGLHNEVIFTGRVPDQDLPPFYSGALFCVYPSYHEGFGLAPLEAMTCGSPLIVHKAGAIAEVVGDAGIVLESIEVENLAVQMSRLVNEPGLREILRQRGLERAKDFSWQRAAENLLGVYNDVGPRKRWEN